MAVAGAPGVGETAPIPDLDVPEEENAETAGAVTAKKKVPSTDTPATQALRRLLHKRVRVRLSDGRVLYGTFLCTDRERNLVLGQCEEHRNPDGSDATSASTLRRQLALLMVPGEHLASFAAAS